MVKACFKIICLPKYTSLLLQYITKISQAFSMCFTAPEVDLVVKAPASSFANPPISSIRYGKTWHCSMNCKDYCEASFFIHPISMWKANIQDVPASPPLLGGLCKLYQFVSEWEPLDLSTPTSVQKKIFYIYSYRFQTFKYPPKKRCWVEQVSDWC